MKILSGIAVLALFVIGACSNGRPQNKDGNQENVHDGPTHEYHESMEAEKGQDSASMVLHNHQVHESIRDNFVHKDIIILENTYQLAPNTEKELKEVIQAYLEMKEAFANDNAVQADSAAGQMQRKVKEVDPGKMDGEGLKAWQQHMRLYIQTLKEMQHLKGLKEKRSYFSHISEIVYCTVKSFGLKADTELFAAYCPMAFDNKGAYWLTNTKKIRNPYFGKAMPDCGEIKEEL